jgi:membrane protein DedA with SNARE-associated domain
MRFVTGFRFLSPLMAAYLGVSYKKYFLANTLSAIVFGPFFIMLGYIFHSQITAVIHTLSTVENGILAAAVLIIVGAGLYYLKKKFRV